ncbi:MAG: cupredoxin domain-containing protein [Thermoplasmata archaeon]|nr:cupredoxin domain-containing protein [Thermoplasmata archaeon]
MPGSVGSKVLSTFLGGLLLLTALVGLAAAAPGPIATVHRAATDQLTVTVGSPLAFTLSTAQVTPGDTVDLTVVQTDDVAHTFTLLNTTGMVFDPNVNSTAQIMAYLVTHPPLVNVTIASGQHESTATFTAPKFGLYEYVCLSDDHFAGGMWGLLGSGEEGSGGTVNTSPGAPVFIIGGTIVGLVVITIVLAFVVGRREGAKHEMPPERLGYAEPKGGATEPKKLP